MKRSIILLTCLSLMACASQQKLNAGTERVTDKSNSETASASAENACNIYESTKWHAWLDKGGEDGGMRLKVSGEVTLPSPGYKVNWQTGPMDRAFPPSLRLRLTTQAPSAGQMNIQVLTAQAVDFTMPSRVPKYRSIMIFCGAELLAEIPDVMLTD